MPRRCQCYGITNLITNMIKNLITNLLAILIKHLIANLIKNLITLSSDQMITTIIVTIPFKKTIPFSTFVRFGLKIHQTSLESLLNFPPIIRSYLSCQFSLNIFHRL